MNESKLPYALSKATEKTRAEVAGLKRELAELTASVDALLRDDKSDANVVAVKIGAVRAKEDLLRARLARRRDELHLALVADGQAERKRLAEAIAAARRRRRELKENWISDLNKAGYRKGAIQRMKLASVDWPRELREAERAVYELSTKALEVGTFVNSIDRAAWEAGQATRAAPMAGHIGAPDFRGAAAKFVPELV